MLTILICSGLAAITTAQAGRAGALSVMAFLGFHAAPIYYSIFPFCIFVPARRCADTARAGCGAVLAGIRCPGRFDLAADAADRIARLRRHVAAAVPAGWRWCGRCGHGNSKRGDTV